MDIQFVLELSAITAIAGAIISYVNFHKNSRLNYITQERKEWREDIRRIAEEIEQCPYRNRKKVLAKLKTRINAFGFCGDNKLKDSHIWDQIKKIENCEESEYEENRETLILFLSLLLKDDWERAKKEVTGEPVKGVLAFGMILAITFMWIGLFEAEGLSIDQINLQAIGLMVFHTLPSLVEIIVVFIFFCGLLYKEKQLGDQSRIIEVLFYDLMWFGLIAMGGWLNVHEGGKSIYSSAAGMMFVVISMAHIVLDVSTCLQRKIYVACIDKVIKNKRGENNRSCKSCERPKKYQK